MENWNDGVRDLRRKERQLGKVLLRWMRTAGAKGHEQLQSKIREIEEQLQGLERILHTGGGLQVA